MFVDRWQQFIDAGASFDWEEYTPHVTIAYGNQGMPLEEIPVFEGDILFGGEVFAELDEDWSVK